MPQQRRSRPRLRAGHRVGRAKVEAISAMSNAVDHSHASVTNQIARCVSPCKRGAKRRDRPQARAACMPEAHMLPGAPATIRSHLFENPKNIPQPWKHESVLSLVLVGPTHGGTRKGYLTPARWDGMTKRPCHQGGCPLGPLAGWAKCPRRRALWPGGPPAPISRPSQGSWPCPTRAWSGWLAPLLQRRRKAQAHVASPRGAGLPGWAALVGLAPPSCGLAE
ncbi:hypothetical protein H6P81_021696 [Aristolochia fimbriata]|uniref:Uncharacterized protein n=1 Tax=Aristolochia fimbriata TaxID=158543 RepID=A0AAV7DP80_ARIFI|nr:hypothetical protein H6P81_021696 [Aristolochia fimbriata]